MPRDKLPARSVMRQYERQTELDRQAIAAVMADGTALSVPAFCAEMARLLRDEERQAEVRREAPLFAIPI